MFLSVSVIRRPRRLATLQGCATGIPNRPIDFGAQLRGLAHIQPSQSIVCVCNRGWLVKGLFRLSHNQVLSKAIVPITGTIACFSKMQAESCSIHVSLLDASLVYFSLFFYWFPCLSRFGHGILIAKFELLDQRRNLGSWHFEGSARLTDSSLDKILNSSWTEHCASLFEPSVRPFLPSFKPGASTLPKSYCGNRCPVPEVTEYA